MTNEMPDRPIAWGIFDRQTGQYLYSIPEHLVAKALEDKKHVLEAQPLFTRPVGEVDMHYGPARTKPMEQLAPKPASETPYDTMCLFLTKDGHWTEGFIYDGDEKDYGYIAYLPLPEIPEWAELQEPDDAECMHVKTWGLL